ncbi:aspartyl-phosphate phosphatase Spo0E family protein [Alkalihalobacillus deserti]|uniref:aspartyl-phosphate phosphatase Spo0E family protein n=1 Tax=Alkalihalobacillus deserti TaxID=2879466 RepID=UPI001D15D2F6|nr:aspartyl-phosphate phosphatase Spo0E family protein [Alkalihalobacillus deserti]
MILKNALDLKKSIKDYRQGMYELARNKDISDPDVIKISKQLDREMIMLQKMIDTIHPLQTGTSRYQNDKHD